MVNGPVILDLLGLELIPEEQEILQHPLVGGVILFTRNYESPQQLKELCQTIRRIKPSILITVDHEGGRVQRFRDGFTRIPPMQDLGDLYSQDPNKGLDLAKNYGKTIASELLAVGIDLSFAPVLDLDKEINSAIGDRAFHRDPEIVVTLAKALIQGMNEAGMAATGKHFPGHGSVTIDSHHAMPIDTRDFNTIYADDMQPFIQLIHTVQAIMPAHILFPEIDDKPVGFSKVWLQDILRKKLQFKGTIFSDDLNMKGAGFAGNYADRARLALEAGCDRILICNNRAGAVEILEQLK